MIFQVYALCDPEDGEVRYVGVTCHLKKRIYTHLQHAKLQWQAIATLNNEFRGKPLYAVQDAKERWLINLAHMGKRPLVKILEETNEQDRLVREKYWIQFWKAQGHQLTNIQQ